MRHIHTKEYGVVAIKRTITPDGYHLIEFSFSFNGPRVANIVYNNFLEADAAFKYAKEENVVKAVGQILESQERTRV